MIFSERYGLSSTKAKLQLDSIDLELKNSLWNTYYNFFIAEDYERQNITLSVHHDYYDLLWRYYFKKPIDEFPETKSRMVSEIRYHFFNHKWFCIYNLIEFTVDVAKEVYSDSREMIIRDFNLTLEMEKSGYRIIDGILVPIASQAEMDSIVNALGITNSEKYIGALKHIEKSLVLLSAKTNPDYPNSIKESISAVESVCKILTGRTKATLADALKTLSNTTPLHPAFEQALHKLYAWTGDADGIRHGAILNNNVKMEDAVFVASTCSAFINYIIAKSEGNFKGDKQ